MRRYVEGGSEGGVKRREGWREERKEECVEGRRRNEGTVNFLSVHVIFIPPPHTHTHTHVQCVV